ncbi:MAG: lipid-A-disaccharide synthase [Gammaproteobacteria bacterium]|nr:lipid-A-disaccharide synthase [Gammaproteobacteria bacterium]MBU2058112.1 lipid-A-disaccharide synthase [Gammaproteobacteria bacterium]MBU2176019.1 lipid-A-disaccharide synthase [Gammaproteobacteria bacterium]MBU2247206.1 lipid-A-disaccharide synthase [Gammaproteobacteria bacterium]MBU2343358.1 lipid-A-disaccharide synthase [Gammaproteobacteria bacterium]
MAELQSKIKIALVAGEHSGDILGADLIRALKLLYPQAEFYGIGGERMKAQGLNALFDMEELAVMGIVEVLGRLPRLLQVRKELLAHLTTTQPDVFIGIDAPDFNIPVELKLKAAGIKTVHYVSPSVWAWRQKRIFKIAKATNMVLALLPFEKAFYDKFAVPCSFVGHTLADQMPLQPDKAAAKTELGLKPQAPVLAIMPGSRTNEIKLLAADYLLAAAELQRQQPDLQLICNMVTEQKAELFRKIKQQVAPDLAVQLEIGKARTTLTAADAVFIASGTATLEAMLAKTAMVVGYKMNWLTHQIAKRLVKLKFFSLPNLLADQALVTELLQEQVTVDNLVKAMAPLLQNPAAQQACIRRFTELHQLIRCNASEQAAAAIAKVMETSV